MTTPIRPYPRDASYRNLGMDLPDVYDEESPLYGLWQAQIPVNIFLASGIKLSGLIDWFDGETITLRNQCDQIVFRNQIATILPALGTFFK